MFQRTQGAWISPIGVSMIWRLTSARVETAKEDLQGPCGCGEGHRPFNRTYGSRREKRYGVGTARNVSKYDGTLDSGAGCVSEVGLAGGRPAEFGADGSLAGQRAYFEENFEIYLFETSAGLGRSGSQPLNKRVIPVSRISRHRPDFNRTPREAHPLCLSGWASAPARVLTPLTFTPVCTNGAGLR